MADILIRGMKMPGKCRECGFAGFGGIRSELNVCMFSGESQSLLSHERMSKCPLVPLPEGHGDLIDRDALKKRTPMVIDYSAGGFGTDGSIRPVRGYGDWQIDQAPTIVPAEGGGEDGK